MWIMKAVKIENRNRRDNILQNSTTLLRVLIQDTSIYNGDTVAFKGIVIVAILLLGIS